MDSIVPTAETGDSCPTARTLLEAVNVDARTARYGSLALSALAAYFCVTIASLTHKDLLLNTRVLLPFLQVEIPINGFFALAPATLLVVHCIVLMQHVTLKGTIEGLNEILSSSERRNDALRLELCSYFFVQAYAGPRRSAIISGLRFIMIGLMLVASPVFTLLYFQVAFLPNHDVLVTNAHRIYLMLDLFLLYLMATTILLPDRKLGFTPVQKLLYTPLLSMWVYGTLLFALFFSLCIATLPGSRLDRVMGRLDRWAELPDFKSMPLIAGVPGAARSFVVPENEAPEHPVFSLTSLLFEGKPDPVSGEPSSWFSRNLVVVDADLVPDDETKDKTGEVSVHLRGRDLRYARLDRTDLHRADLTGADLRHASLIGANLSMANLHKADLRYSNLNWAELRSARLSEADLSGSLLREAQLEDADLNRADMQSAILNWAKLKNANLSRTDLSGATLSWAELHGTRLVWTELAEANLFGAKLHEAQLDNWQLKHTILAEADFGPIAEEVKTRIRRALQPRSHELLGVWLGKVQQPNFAGKKLKGYSVKLSINEFGIGYVDYPELSCLGKSSGTKFGDVYVFAEKIHEGRDNCRDGHVKMRVSGNVMNWEWYYADGRLGASGKLTKRE